MRIRYLIITIILLSCIPFLHAKDDNSIEIISVSQGIPNSNINSIHLGKQGLMWIGTSNGLCFYDGYNFNVIQSVPFDSTTLADDNIKGIVQNKSLDIWLQTNYGVEKIDFTTGKVHRIEHFINPSNIIELVTSFEVDSIFVILKNGIVVLESDGFKKDSLFFEDSLNLRGGTLINHELILLTDNTVIKYNIHTGERKVYKIPKTLYRGDYPKTITWKDKFIIYSNFNKLFSVNIHTGESSLLHTASGPITSLSQHVGGVIAFTSQFEVFQLKLDDTGNIFAIRKILSIAGYSIQHISQDKNQMLWIATNRGIVKLNPHSEYIKHEPIPSDIIRINSIEEIVYESSKKGIVYYTSTSKLSFLNTTTNKITPLPINSCNEISLIDNEYLIAGNENGLFQISLDGRLIESYNVFNGISVYSIQELDDIIWVSTSDGLYRGVEGEYEQICDIIIDKFIVFDNTVYYTSDYGFGQLDVLSCNKEILLDKSSKREYVSVLDILQSYDGKIWLATDDGLYQFNPNAERENRKPFELVYKGNVLSLIESKNQPEVWFSTDLGIGTINYQTQQIMFLGYEDGVRQTSFVQEAALEGLNGSLIFLSQHETLSFHPDSVFRNKNIPNVYISQVNLIRKDLSSMQFYYSSDTLLILPDTRFVELFFTTFDYYAPLHTVYEYSLTKSGKHQEWKRLNDNVLTLGADTPGEYILNVRARNSHGLVSDSFKELIIVVKAPIYRSRFAVLGYIILLGLFIMTLIQLRTRNLSRKNREYKDRERIAKKVEQQKEELTLKNKNITDSINYARRIQLAMMPSVRLFKAIFPDSFILHMPKDIVSGDFYWVNHVKNKIFFSAVDCTGHGVPGAFMSIIGVELFRRITEIEKIFTPAEVLNSLSKNFERVFGDVDEMKLRDGMDLAFCSLNEDHTLLEYAGAFNPLYIVRNNSIMEIKGDRQSVGVYEDEDEIRSFNNHVIPLQDGDILYIFTDGYVDQFGGPEGKKYKYRRFRHLLLALHELPMEKQIDFLKKSILEWKGEQEQVDDILVMGIRIHHNK